MIIATYKGAFSGCNWCHGNGCLMCDKERRRAEELMMQPIFVAKRDNQKDMEALRRIAGAEVLERDYAENSGNMEGVMRAVNQRAAVESVLQLLRNREKTGEA